MLFVVLLTVVLLLVILWQIDVRLKLKLTYAAAVRLPGAYMYPLVGNLFQILFLNPEQTFRFLRANAALHKKSNRFWIFGVLHYNVIKAADIEVVLSSTKHITKSELYNFLHPLMGTGLLTSTGKKWFQRRRILTPAFHFNILQDFLCIFREESQKLVKNLSASRHRNGTVLQKLIPRFTLNTICESAMGVKVDSIQEPDAYRTNLYKMGEWLVYRCMNPCLHTDAIYKMSGLPLILNKYLKPVHSFSWGIIDRRRKAFAEIQIDVEETPNSNTDINNNTQENLYFGNKKKRYAMLDTLLAAEANDNQIDDIGIREEVDTFMFEGYDTTSAGITFTLFMLAHHWKEQNQVYNEIVGTIGDRNVDDLTVQDFSSMQYFDMFIKETLRLYPAVPFMGRQLMESLRVGDVELPVGTQIHIHTFDLHRDPEQFPDPETFDPDRFLPVHRDDRHPFAYVAFSAGPRNCIGQRYAMLEIKTLVAHILMSYEITPITRVEDVIFVSDIVLRTKNPIEVKFSARPKHGVGDVNALDSAQCSL